VGRRRESSTPTQGPSRSFSAPSPGIATQPRPHAAHPPVRRHPESPHDHGWIAPSRKGGDSYAGLDLFQHPVNQAGEKGAAAPVLRWATGEAPDTQAPASAINHATSISTQFPQPYCSGIATQIRDGAIRNARNNSRMEADSPVPLGRGLYVGSISIFSAPCKSPRRGL
jgi:hypothetical protein